MYWILAILMFGILIMLHELGHFLAARLTGVTVLEFAVGFGPKLVSRTAKSGVTYSLRALPLGGYCRFVGDEEEGEKDRPDALSKQKIWKRVLISLSGPLMNVLTALLVLFLLFFAVGLQTTVDPVVDSLLEGLPAEAAGLLPGDRIVSVNGQTVEAAQDASAYISAAGGSEIVMGVLRDGEPAEVTITPQWVDDEENGARYMIGIQYRMSESRQRLGFADSVRSAWVVTGDMARLIVDVLRDLIFKGEGMDELSGPIGTVTVIKEETERGGIANYLYLAAVISVNLGLFNLLPVPGLDGSKLIFLLLEKIRGKPLDPNKEGIITLVGFALLLGLMGIAMYQDIARLIG